MVSIVNAISTWLLLFYALCDYGEDVAKAFEALSISIYGISWPLCPLEIQRLLVMMIRASQEPVHLRGYPSINCSRNIFKQVMQLELEAFSAKTP